MVKGVAGSRFRFPGSGAPGDETDAARSRRTEPRGRGAKRPINSTIEETIDTLFSRVFLSFRVKAVLCCLNLRSLGALGALAFRLLDAPCRFSPCA